jgi:hypothetical protein
MGAVGGMLVPFWGICNSVLFVISKDYKNVSGTPVATKRK